jgi:hypothetical protein
LLPQLAGYLVVYLAGLAASSTTLFVALHAFSHPGSLLETLLALASGALATLVRFVLLSRWVFHAPIARSTTHAARGTLTVPAPGHD